jgi:hypothetical protein
MDKREARELLGAQVLALRALPYAELVKEFRSPVVKAIAGPSGTVYQVEIQSFWDDRPGRNLRVLASIDDGRGLRAFLPLTDDFIIDPTGVFVGE